MTNRILPWLSITALAAFLPLAACSISSHEDGSHERVSIEAPGASVQVNAGKSANDSGLPVYPGAQEKQGSDKDKDNARVDLNTPFLKMKVVAIKYTSSDSPEKVLAYYRSKLTGFGTVVECQGGEQVKVTMGSSHSLDSPVGCGDSGSKSGEVSLRVGTEGNQHVVTVKPNGSGSEFSLVFVHMNAGKDEDRFSGKQPS